MVIKSYYPRHIDNLFIIIGGYLSFVNLFIDNILFTIISIAVIAGEIYKLNIPKKIFKNDYKKFGDRCNYIRNLTVFICLIQIVGGLMIINGILLLDFSLTFYGFILLFINILLLRDIKDKMTRHKVSRSKINKYGTTITILSNISLLLGIGGQMVLSTIAFVIGLNKTIVKKWRKIKKKNLSKIALEIVGKKEEEEIGLIWGWSDIYKSKQQNLLFGTLSMVLLVVIFNIQFINLRFIFTQAIEGHFSINIIFLSVITIVVFLIYIGIRQQWNNWKKCILPYVIFATLLFYYLLYPTSLPLYNGFIEMIPSYDYLGILGYNFSFSSVLKYAILVAAQGFSFLFLGFLISLLFNRKNYLIIKYEQFPIAESETAVYYFFSATIGFLIIGLVYNMIWSELYFLLYPMFTFLLMIFGIMCFLFLFIITKEQAMELWYYRCKNFKKSMSPARFLGWMIEKKKITRKHSWPQLGYLFIIGVLALTVSLSIFNFISPPEETVSFENASESIKIQDFMSIDGYNHSYGWFGYLDVEDYVYVNLKVFSNDTVGFYLKSDKYESETTFVKGPDNETIHEYTNLDSDRYQLIYYNALDENEDEEMTIYINILRSPRKSYFIGPETLPLFFTWILYFIRPSYVIAKMKKKDKIFNKKEIKKIFQFLIFILAIILAFNSFFNFLPIVIYLIIGFISISYIIEFEIYNKIKLRKNKLKTIFKEFYEKISFRIFFIFYGFLGVLVTKFYSDITLTTPFNGNNLYYTNDEFGLVAWYQIDSNGEWTNSFSC